MSADAQENVLPAEGFPRRSRRAPVVALLILAPVIGEVLSGATRLSYIFVLVPEIMVWGCGTLVIRELVRRWRAGWTSALLLGFGLAVAEEFVIQQTSLAPLPFPGASAAYGRVLGVNWPYFVFMLAYEAVWIVMVPMQIAELVFDDARDQPWLRPRGIVVSTLVFALGSFVAWFLWTRQARPNAFHVPIYDPPAPALLLGIAAIVLLALAAHALRKVGKTVVQRVPPRPWVVLTAALVLGFPWYLLLSLVFAPHVDVALWVPMALACAWAAFGYLLIRRWASASGWRDLHRWALCFGALLVCMSAGFLGASAWTRLDVVGKAVLNVIAILGMVMLRGRIVKRVVAQRRAQGAEIQA